MNDVGRDFEFPQGLKPSVNVARSGTAEGVPFHITFMRPALRHENLLGAIGRPLGFQPLSADMSSNVKFEFRATKIPGPANPNLSIKRGSIERGTRYPANPWDLSVAFTTEGR